MFERQITLRRVKRDNNYCTPNNKAVKANAILASCDDHALVSVVASPGSNYGGHAAAPPRNPRWRPYLKILDVKGVDIPIRPPYPCKCYLHSHVSEADHANHCEARRIRQARLDRPDRVGVHGLVASGSR